MHEVVDEKEPELDDILKRLSPCDIVLVEGYKREDHPKIETIRADSQREQPIWHSDDSIIALATDAPDEACPLPQFSADDPPAIADMIVDLLGLDKRDAAE